MKTPWRFVADLVSRKPKTHSHGKASAAAPTTLALEYKPTSQENPDIETAADDAIPATRVEEISTTPLLEAESPPAIVGTAPSIEEGVPDASVAVAEPAARPTSPQQEEVPSPAAQTFPATAETPVKPVQARRTKVEPITDLLAYEGRPGEVAPAVAAGPKSLTEEMADLDAEVDVLRRQLAVKLAEQNAQLRRMLARFEGR